MDLAFNVPLNRLSFGQCGLNLLKAAKAAGHNVFLFPIGQNDLGTSSIDNELGEWIQESFKKGVLKYNKDIPCIKLWHLAMPDESNNVKGCYESVSNKTTFISFYELDSPTELELNVARNFDTVFTSSYTCDVFAENNVKTRYVPLGFDSDHFKVVNKKFWGDDRIVFCLLGKFEQRKHHSKVIKAWVKHFGNNKKYYLQLAVHNPFFNPQMMANLLAGSMEGKHYWNVNPLNYFNTNASYNDFLNSNHIVLGMSGGEGWGLPEFHTVALGKHAVILNAHSYKNWANEENAVLINPLNKVSSVDGVFFKAGFPYNQGSIFNFDEDEFIAGCEKAIERYKRQTINHAGLKLQTEFTWAKTLEKLINKN